MSSKPSFRAIVILTFATLWIISCHTAPEQNIEKDNINSQQENRVEVDIYPFYKALISIDTLNIDLGIKKLYANDSNFFKQYVEEVIGVEFKQKDKIKTELYGFLTSKEVVQLNQQVLDTYQNLDTVADNLSTLFSRLQYDFPTIKQPRITFFVSGLNKKILYQEKNIGIGIDFYLGEKCRYYKQYFYQYQQYLLQPKFLSIDILDAVIRANIKFETDKDRLLENMLIEGKIAYLKQKTLSQNPLEDILGYTPQQYQWAMKYEAQIWKTIVGKKDLFSTDKQLINRYLNPAPFTSPISQESPGRLGVFIGYRIIDSFMKHNQNTTTAELVGLNDAQYILQKSNY